MGKAIEIYINEQELLAEPMGIDYSVPAPPMRRERPYYSSVHYGFTGSSFKTKRKISDADAEALAIVEKASIEKGFKVKRCNVSTPKGRIYAFIRGVRSTPTIVYDGNKVKGLSEIREYLSSLGPGQ